MVPGIHSATVSMMDYSAKVPNIGAARDVAEVGRRAPFEVQMGFRMGPKIRRCVTTDRVVPTLCHGCLVCRVAAPCRHVLTLLQKKI